MIKVNANKLISSWFFIGFAPYAPGTCGAVAALPMCFILSIMNDRASFGVIIFIILLAIYTSESTEKLEEKKDPQEIVIDEVVGMMVTLHALPFTLINIILGFSIFRILDISKPQPIKFVERRLSGGLGVVLDDVLGGIFSNLIIRFLTACMLM